MKQDNKILPLTILGAVISIIFSSITAYLLVFSKKTVVNLPVGAEVIPKDTMMMTNLWAIHHDPKANGKIQTCLNPNGFSMSKETSRFQAPRVIEVTCRSAPEEECV